eukprot:4275416-Prymnesium_polylepis.2
MLQRVEASNERGWRVAMPSLPSQHTPSTFEDLPAPRCALPAIRALAATTKAASSAEVLSAGAQ